MGLHYATGGNDPTQKIVTGSRRWPIVIVTCPVAVADDQLLQYLAYFDQLREERPEPHALVLDLRVTDRLTPVQRRQITDRMKTGNSGQQRLSGSGHDL